MSNLKTGRFEAFISMVKPNVLKPEGCFVNLTFCKPDVLKPDVLKPNVMKPDVLKPDVLKPDVLWVYHI